MDATGDYYATLRVAPEAENAAIRLAYRDLMRRYHPDVNRSDEAATRATAINEAYACLRDPSERAAYDRRLGVQRIARSPDAADAAAWPQRSAWRAQHSYIVEEEAEPRPGWWRPAGLGLATMLTIFLFAITSATPPNTPNSDAVIVVKTDIGDHAQTKAGNVRAPGDRAHL